MEIALALAVVIVLAIIKVVSLRRQQARAWREEKPDWNDAYYHKRGRR